MNRTFVWMLAAGATTALLAAAPSAFAQTSTGQPAPTDQVPAPAEAPSATPAPTAPQAPSAAPAPAPAEAAPSASTPDTKLPDVEVVQPQPTPKAQPESEPPKVVVKKKPAAAAPTVAAKPKPKPKPQVQPAPEPEPIEAVQPEPVSLPTPAGGPPGGDTQIKMSPVAGSEIPLTKVPGAVGRATAADVAREGSGQVQQVLQQQVPGVILSDTAGNPLRSEVSYRGFDASPVGGRAQGLAVYLNGIRINEAFGDTVNWDAIPAIAISDISILGSNPVFGLNAIGGAVSVTTKDGFGFQGATIDVMGGSFGRRQIAGEAGARSGNFAAYAAAEYVAEDGFRDFSDAEIKRMYTDLGVKGDAVELHFSLNAAKSSVGVTAAAPAELLDMDWSRTFTSPQDTEYELLMPSLRGSVKATDTTTVSALAYYRKFKQKVIDGNLSDVDECDDGGPNAGKLCLSEDGVEEPVEDAKGNTINADLFDGPLGSIERINQDAESWGGSTQLVEKTPLFGRPNQFLVGVSYDHGKVGYTTSSELGTIGDRFVVAGSGIIAVEPDDLMPRNLTTENTYYGVYFSDTLDVTDALAVTVGGRWNSARIKMEDLTGEFSELNSTNKYERFNPMAGATYQLGYGLTLFGNYSEANRAPTAAELACADPDNPCLIESFLTDDPPLKQVISKSWEAGIRGEHKNWNGEKLSWSLGYYRTLNTDDLLNVAAETSGRGYFLNAGDTLRQGIEASIGYQTLRWSAYASYTLVDATFRDDLVLPAPNTPGAESCPDTDPADEVNCNFVTAGDRLPGIPRHRFKAGIEYWLTPQWKVGTDLVAATGQFYYGDEANQNSKLAGYTRIDLHTSYDITENVQVYGLVKNLFDRRYGLYGTFFDTEEASEAAEPQGITFHDPRTYTPAQPFAVYGGLKVKF